MYRLPWLTLHTASVNSVVVVTRELYADLVQRLAVQSVAKHFDAYADVAWDAPENAIRVDDPRWELSPDQSLGATAWYRAQPAQVRSEIGLHVIANSMKVGVIFENVLKRGLLEYASTLDNRSVEFRYAYHEVIEEAQHSLMFQEFINRTPFDPRGLPPHTMFAARRVVHLGRVFPELFFLFVLGGEEPIDFVQRRELRSARELHPLLRRISQIHVTEEARHLCFARRFLQERVPKLSLPKRVHLGIAAPVILSQMASMMLEPSRGMILRYQIPREVIREAFTDNPKHRASVQQSLASVMQLCRELRILHRRNAPLWRGLGLGDPAVLAPG
jgi:P-aminobenzoate N-oxygenase AurF